MAVVVDFDYHYEGSDESSESDLLDRSLSVWRGWQIEDEPDFKPVPLDLHTAASIGQYDHVWSIIDRREEDINRKCIGGWTPLMYACYIGHDTIVSLLIEAGANVNAKNGKGQSPLMLAASCGNESVTFVLIQANADIEGRDKKGWTALFHATYSGHQNMVKFLLDNKANPEAKEPSREFTPFMEAASAGHEIIVQYFLQHGVEVNATSLSGDTARSLAMATGHTKIVSLIDNHLLGPTHSLRPEPSLEKDLSSSDENFHSPLRQSRQRRRPGADIAEGPAALAKKFDKIKQQKGGQNQESFVPTDYIQFNSANNMGDMVGPNHITSRDMIAPIRPDDHKDVIDPNNSAFLRTDAVTVKRSGLMSALRLSRDSSIDSSEEYEVRSTNSDPGHVSSDQPPTTEVKRQGRAIRGKQFNDGPKNQELNSDYRKVQSSPAIVSGQHDGTVRPPPGFGFMLAPHGDALTVNPPPISNESLSPHFTHASQQVISGQFPQLLGNLSTVDQQKRNVTSSGNALNSFDIYSSERSGTSQDNMSMKTTNNNNDKIGTDFGEVPAINRSSSLSTKARQEQQEVLENRPQDLETLLEELGLTKYMQVFDEQDVDLQVFLTLTDSDLKEVGITRFGPRRKMTNAITRWHLNAQPARKDLEQAYSDKLMAEVQEMGVQINQSSKQCESLEKQLLQEQELRSVAEQALMEDKTAFHHVHRLTSDIRQRCDNLKDILVKINLYQSELIRRFGAESPFSRSGSHGRESLAKALTEKLLLTQQEQEVSPEITHLPTQQIIRRLEYLHDQVATLVALITTNADKMLGRDLDGQNVQVNHGLVQGSQNVMTQQGIGYDYSSLDS